MRKVLTYHIAIPYKTLRTPWSSCGIYLEFDTTRLKQLYGDFRCQKMNAANIDKKRCQAYARWESLMMLPVWVLYILKITYQQNQRFCPKNRAIFCDVWYHVVLDPKGCFLAGVKPDEVSCSLVFYKQMRMVWFDTNGWHQPIWEIVGSCGTIQEINVWGKLVSMWNLELLGQEWAGSDNRAFSHNPEVVGSSPASATRKKSQYLLQIPGFFYLFCVFLLWNVEISKHKVFCFPYCFP